MTDKNSLAVYSYIGNDVRMIIAHDGAPWFVAADALGILDLDRTALRRLDDDEKGVDSIHTLGGSQQVNVVNEPGLYSLILGSRKPEAKEFKRWVTHVVLPEIRSTGSYMALGSLRVPAVPAVGVDVATIRQLNNAVGVLLESNEQLTAKVTELAPAAAAWDELASAAGDYEVADAAKILARAGVETGRQRLFDQLATLGWIHRGSHGKWKAYQTAVDNGYLAELPQSHHHPRTGELVLDPPQVRVTVRGLERLRVRLGSLESRPNLRAVNA